MTNNSRTEGENLIIRSQIIIENLTQFAANHDLYDLAILSNSIQPEVGQFYDYRLGMEPVYRLIRIYRDFYETYLPNTASKPKIEKGLFQLTLAISKYFSALSDVECMPENLGDGRVQITIYFGLD
ncbi:MAG: hypothetical protein QNL04_01070 [SAR324 cluster bacterium]|nr:hypothetical protein [SAR324 cluster bacterium]